LNAVLNKTLRLLPSIASRVQRFTPAEGLQIACVQGKLSDSQRIWARVSLTE